MDVNEIRDFVNDHPDGVEFTMIDGASYKLPHRDYIWFAPASASRSGGPPRRFATSFYLNIDGRTRLVNALLVKHVREWRRNGTQKRRKSA
jgi:hypothetical protein